MGELTTQNERNLTLMVSLLVPVCAGLSEFDEVTAGDYSKCQTCNICQNVWLHSPLRV